jgi:hypothetical protein
LEQGFGWYAYGKDDDEGHDGGVGDAVVVDCGAIAKKSPWAPHPAPDLTQHDMTLL